ncbi:hypothetical protein OIU78_000779 [Salix suchowensis]|nr:hypothetical protein OIU78_000779 [Salix suchowensis]
MAAFWKRQLLVAREYASTTIIPACKIIVDIVNSAKNLIDKEVNAFLRSPDNSHYMLPSFHKFYEIETACWFSGIKYTSTFSSIFMLKERKFLIKFYQALLESMGSNGSTGPEAAAALLTARAGASDPSAIPSICRVSAALQYPAGKFLLFYRRLEA